VIVGYHSVNAAHGSRWTSRQQLARSERPPLLSEDRQIHVGPLGKGWRDSDGQRFVFPKDPGSPSQMMSKGCIITSLDI